MILEIYTDASIRTFNNGRVFGCAGALCPRTGESKYTILPDSTNNKAELIGIYNGILLAHNAVLREPEMYNQIDLYSDSQFGIFGLTKWIYGWVRTMDINGIIYGSNKQPVKNQELFLMILSYLSTNNLRINFYHQAGHVRYTSQKMLEKANRVFKTSNGFSLLPEDIYKISYYNDIVDRTSRDKLQNINPDNFAINNINECPVRYVLPKNFRQYISNKGGTNGQRANHD